MTDKNTYKAAIMHIHTAGTNAEQDDIIQMGVLPLDGSGTPHVSLFGSTTHLSAFSRRRSGLNNEIIRNCDAFSRCSVPDIDSYDHVFIMDTTLGNEIEFISNKVITGSSEKVINILYLTQFFFPGLKDYSIEGLYRNYFITDIGGGKDLIQRQMQLAERLLKNIMELFSKKDTVFYAHLPTIIQNIENSPALSAIQELSQNCKNEWLKSDLLICPNNVDETADIVNTNGADLIPEILAKNKEAINVQNAAPPDSFQELPENITHNFFHSGFLKKKLKNYLVRESQVEFSGLITRSLNTESHAYIEAPTGVGKTVGYCLPAGFFLEKNQNRKIVVATATKNLQEQVLSHDWPLIKERFPSIKVAVLKGKSNYPCPSALARQFNEYFTKGDSESRSAWLFLANFCYSTEGDLEKIPYQVKKSLPVLRDLIKDVSAYLHCVQKLCVPKSCIYGTHLRLARMAQLIITNHHKVPQMDSEIMDATHMMIIDEADRFADNVRNALTIEISSSEISRLLYRLVGSNQRRGYLQILQDSVQRKGMAGKPNPTADKIERCIMETDEFKTAMTKFIECVYPGGNFKAAVMYLLPCFKNKTIDLKIMLKLVLSPLLSLRNLLEELLDDNDDITASQETRLQSYKILLDELADRIEDFAEDFRSKSAVHEFQGDKSRWCLRKTPVYIQEFLKGNVYKNVPRMFFTSATLRINDTSDFIESELGSDDANITTIRECLESPFNLKNQVYCAVDTSIHPYDYYQIAAYRDSVKEAIADYVLSIDGRTLVLFMSHMELSYTYNQLEPRFIDAGILPIRQNGTSLDKIEEFRRVEESVLFGVDRFWAGVDFPGSTLSQVIIVKAPNPALSNPVITHRRLFEDDFMNSTYGHIGAMKIRQGFGRLIRKMDDRGAVIILDSRYQARFQDHLENLPVLPEFSENRQEIMKNVTMVMKNKTFSTIK